MAEEEDAPELALLAAEAELLSAHDDVLDAEGVQIGDEDGADASVRSGVRLRPNSTFMKNLVSSTDRTNQRIIATARDEGSLVGRHAHTRKRKQQHAAALLHRLAARHGLRIKVLDNDEHEVEPKLAAPDGESAETRKLRVADQQRASNRMFAAALAKSAHAAQTKGARAALSTVTKPVVNPVATPVINPVATPVGIPRTDDAKGPSRTAVAQATKPVSAAARIVRARSSRTDQATRPAIVIRPGPANPRSQSTAADGRSPATTKPASAQRGALARIVKVSDARQPSAATRLVRPRKRTRPASAIAQSEKEETLHAAQATSAHSALQRLKWK